MPLRGDLLTPIPGENPSGANLRYDPVTDKIKEARREDDPNLAQGEWATALKIADYPAVIEMAGEALANRGKDLQIAVWLVDAHIRWEGFSAVAPCFRFLHDLLEQFWDTLYPPIDEDGDTEVRAARLVWLASVTRLPEKGIESLGYLPIVSGKMSWSMYRESRSVGYQAAADTGEKQEALARAIGEGKITADEFDAAANATSSQALRDTHKNLIDGIAALESFTGLCDEKFGDCGPWFSQTLDALEEVASIVKGILIKRPDGWESVVDADAFVIPGATEPPGVAVRVNPKDGLRYVWIPSGVFQMGASPGDSECADHEKPAHAVTITKGFWMGQTPVTQEAYEPVTGKNPSYFKGPNLPVEQVNREEAQAYCLAIGGRLPTEAEWEYAARAGTTQSRYAELDRIAWHRGNSGFQTHPVGRKQGNQFGLYDMLGNVCEWTADWLGDYAPEAQSDPTDPALDRYGVVRGGSWYHSRRHVRASDRLGQYWEARFVGFRSVWDHPAPELPTAPPAGEAGSSDSGESTDSSNSGRSYLANSET